MPSIFRKRFLRTGDVLDPNEMNQDFQPWMGLLSGNLTADNLNASAFADQATVSSEAHLKHQYTEVMCALPFLTGVTADRQPNFLKKMINDGYGSPTDESAAAAYEFEDHNDTGSPITFDYHPSNVQVIGKGGGWTPLKDGIKLVDFTVTDGSTYETAPGSITTSSDGEVDLWINAFVQYVRNGFGRTFDSFLDPAMSAASPSAYAAHNPALGSYGGDTSPLDYGVRFVPPIDMEIVNPSRAACSHVSMGHSPADVQFAIRVDGQILEETITGKRNTHERTPLGMRNVETRAVDNDAVHTDKPSAGLSKPSGGNLNQKMPGNRSPTVRSAGLGPEVFGTRLSTVVRMGAGSHKIEIVARRLNNVDGIYNLPNDAVGVLNRQLSVTSISRDRHVSQSMAPSNLPAFDTEDPLQLIAPTQTLEKLLNNIPPNAVKSNSLRHQHLKSIVRNWSRKSIKPIALRSKSLPQAEDGRSWLTLSSLHARDYGGLHETESASLLAGTGWQALSSDTFGDYLMVSNTDGTSTSGTIEPNDLIYVFADLVCNITPEGDMPMRERLLDTFAHFCIGHREYNSKIGDESKSKVWRFDRASRVTVNLNNWIGRDINYNMTIAGSDDGDHPANESDNPTYATASIDRRVMYDNLVDMPDSIHVSLMFVLDGKNQRTPPGTSAWEIGDIAVFGAGTQSGGREDGTIHGSGSNNWNDVFWERAGTEVSDPKYRTSGGYEFQTGGGWTDFTCRQPIITFNQGMASISLLRLNRSPE
jgi:hypothetical protein